MTQQELEQLYNKVLELTKKKALDWKQADGNGEIGDGYVVHFPTSTLQIETSEGTDPILYVRNQDGLIVAHMGTVEMPEWGRRVGYYDLDLNELLDLVENQVYKYQETRDNIFSELEKVEKAYEAHAE